jgi:hypothetical protein
MRRPLAPARGFAPVLAKRYGSAAFLLGSTLSDIFREIEDELRRENLQRLWSRFGKYIIGLAVLAVVATVGVMGWQNYQQRQRQAQGVHYVAALALAREGKDAEAGAAFAELAKNANGGLAALAQLDSAAAKAQAGDVAGAIAAYDQLAANGSADPIFRDIATLLAARYSLDKGDPHAVIARLEPLTNASSPWHGLAIELRGVAELKAGDTAKARADFAALAKDSAVPAGVRQRAVEMQAAIGP